MKYGIIFLSGVLVLTSCQRKADPKTEDEKIIYAMGQSIGKSVKRFEISKDQVKYLCQGLEDETVGAPAKVNFEEYSAKIRQFTESKMAAQSTKEKEESNKFIASVANTPGIQKTTSGALYKITKEGTGASPTINDTLKVHYHGTLRDGKVFDSSVQRNEPATFPLNGVIKCWQDAMPNLKVGGKMELYCPPDLAYGDRGNPAVPGGAALKFEVELLEIVKANPTTTNGKPDTKKKK